MGTAGGKLTLTFTRNTAPTDMTLTETGTGATRTVEVRDIFLTNDPAHPFRFLRLRVQH